MSMTSKKNRIFLTLIVVLTVLVLAVGCGKKEEAVVKATPSPVATVSESVKTEPVETSTEPEVVEEVAVEPVEVVAEPIEEVVVEEVKEISAFPVKLEATVLGEKFEVEAHDGYAFIGYPEGIADEDIEAFLDSIVKENPALSGVVGWTIEEPGLLLVAYPFGLTPAEIELYAQTLESFFI